MAAYAASSRATLTTVPAESKAWPQSGEIIKYPIRSGQQG